MSTREASAMSSQATPDSQKPLGNAFMSPSHMLQRSWPAFPVIIQSQYRNNARNRTETPGQPPKLAHQYITAGHRAMDKGIERTIRQRAANWRKWKQFVVQPVTYPGIKSMGKNITTATSDPAMSARV